MKVEEFIKLFNLYDFEIIKIKSSNNNLELTVKEKVDIEYIGNGIRPTFDYEVTHLFIFVNQDKVTENNSIQYVKDYEYQNNILKLELTIDTLFIKNNDVIIKNNI